MKIITESNILGIEKDHKWAEQFTLFRYKDGSTSGIPKAFFRNWSVAFFVKFVYF